ncbi:glutathione S-transferase [Methylobacterium phyllostachyos]|uniref:Glutathione S-transferase n=1 Tax=Methylobacterium phyllostachyos TaxID=582672 RepID=A0A1H0IXK0_9HYPH|nr:glutathione transferase GstA [Methylobacterium phyllostachyos]SDO36072.1 glutathione S-transferase [Methylobacterium phyllostachyos]
MKLFYAAGACSLSPHIVLRELGLSFSLESVDLKTKTTASGADFTTINPKGYVPALQLDDGEVLTEGAAIVQYLADAYAPGRLAPTAGTTARARVDAHLTFIASELHKGFSPLFNPALDPEARVAAVAHLDRRLDIVETAFADGRAYLTGPDFTIADAYLFVVLNWAKPLGLDLTRRTALAAFGARVRAREAVQAALAAEGLPTAA